MPTSHVVPMLQHYDLSWAVYDLNSNRPWMLWTLPPLHVSFVGNKKQVQRRDAFLLAMHQESNQRRKLSHECIALLAASRGHLDAVLAEGGLAGTDKGREAIDGLIDFVESNASGVVTEIESSLDLSSEGRGLLEDAIASYFSKDN